MTVWPLNRWFSPRRKAVALPAFQFHAAVPRPLLLVEDQPSDAELALMTIRGAGHVCDWTQSGEAALYMQAQKDYRLVIIDVGLIKMNGWELAKRIRMTARLMPICIYTGAPEQQENMLKIIPPGMPLTFLLKSPRMDALLEFIDMTPQ